MQEQTQTLDVTPKGLWWENYPYTSFWTFLEIKRSQLQNAAWGLNQQSYYNYKNRHKEAELKYTNSMDFRNNFIKWSKPCTYPKFIKEIPVFLIPLRFSEVTVFKFILF